MKKRKLGKTGLQVSELGFGCWAIGGASYGPTDDRESERALSFAFDEGINFFDTADTYGHGHSEELVGKVFKPSSKRSQVIIASKVGWDFYHGGNRKNFDADYVLFACEQSLKRLGTDHIDLYQLHNPKLEMIEEGSVFKTLAQLEQAGKIRYWGVSIYLAREGQAVIQNGTSASIQAIYSMLDQRIRAELMPFCREHEIGLVVREPLYCGLLTGKYSPESKFRKDDHRNRWTREQLLNDLEKIERMKQAFDVNRVPLKQAAIEFVLHEKTVSVVIPGMKTVSHVEDHLKAVRAPQLTQEDIRQIQKVYRENELFQAGFYRN
ncbi:MAG: aldo/keto reductase [Candidatus Omnitrophica bacterium]|nr:aldo/keto reductase [Candidatus Omnitrophota bacterium]